MSVEKIIQQRIEQAKRQRDAERAKATGSRDERLRKAVDTMTRDIKEHAYKQGRDVSESSARRTAEGLANDISREDSNK